MKIKCLFGYHDWGTDRNVRPARVPWPFAGDVLLYLFFCGQPQECDRTCKHCGKTKTFPYP